MCFDDQAHALAQRYYRAAAELAADNNDPAGYAVALRALSVQARTLGHHRHAIQLAETAGIRKVAPARQAFLYGQVVATADGDRTSALTALTALAAAERRLDQATSHTNTGTRAGSAAPMGDYHPAALAHQQAAVRALLGDREGAITALTTSLRHRPPEERRSRAITTARLAELHLAQGHLDQAITPWHAFLDDYPHLNSGRATTALKTLRSQLRPHATNPAAKHLLARATT
jgi:tetratricopeptide (TPR) repeat protein